MMKNSGCRISVGNFWHGKFKLTPQDVHLVKKEEDENIKKVDVENVWRKEVVVWRGDKSNDTFPPFFPTRDIVSFSTQAFCSYIQS